MRRPLSNPTGGRRVATIGVVVAMLMLVMGPALACKPDPGQITIRKVVSPATDAETEFVFTETGEGLELDDHMLNHNDTGSDEVEPGAYTVAETVPEGWKLVNITCDDGESEIPSTVSLGTATATINVETGEDVTCTFTNEELGQINVVKEVTEGSDRGEDFTFEADFALAPNPLSHGEMGESGYLSAGTYSVSEIVPGGWELQSATCSDESPVSAIALSAGETVTCTFVNDELPPEPGNIIVVKEVTEGSDTETSFEFSASYDGDGFSLSDGEKNDSGDLPAGTYSVSEIVPSGWELQSATCSDESPVSAIALSAGETVTCTFVNDELPPEPGKIIVVKEVTEGSDTETSFEFSASYDGDGFSLSDGEKNDSGDLPAGTYSVSETIPAGWAQLAAVCDDESDPSAISLQEGETVICTFTNVQSEVKASVIVTVGGVCLVDAEGKGYGAIDVSMSIAGSATVIVKHGDAVVESLIADGVVKVPEGQTYSWVATPNEGFEFPGDFVASGTVTIETCSIEVLPFTGMETEGLIALSILLVGTGAMLVVTSRRLEQV